MNLIKNLPILILLFILFFINKSLQLNFLQHKIPHSNKNNFKKTIHNNNTTNQNTQPNQQIHAKNNTNSNNTINTTQQQPQQFPIQLLQIPAQKYFQLLLTPQKQPQKNYNKNTQQQNQTKSEQQIFQKENKTLLTNFLQSQYLYSANLTIDQKQPFSFFLDFNSSVFMVKSYSCLDCTNKQVGVCVDDCKFNYPNANLFYCQYKGTQCSPLNKLANIDYKQQGSFSGYYAQANIETNALTSQYLQLNLTSKFPFVICNIMNKMQWLQSDGIFGLSPNQTYHDNSHKDYQNSGLIQTLIDQNQLKNFTFSIFLDFQNDFLNQNQNNNNQQNNTSTISLSNMILGSFSPLFKGLENFYSLNLQNSKNQYQLLNNSLQNITIDNSFPLKLEQSQQKQSSYIINMNPNIFYLEFPYSIIQQIVKIYSQLLSLNCYIGDLSHLLICDSPPSTITKKQLKHLNKQNQTQQNQPNNNNIIPDLTLQLQNLTLPIQGDKFIGQIQNEIQQIEKNKFKITQKHYFNIKLNQDYNSQNILLGRPFFYEYYAMFMLDDSVLKIARAQNIDKQSQS